MRLYTVTIACRLKEDGDPDFDVNVDVEDGVPAAVLDTIGTAVQNVGRSITAQMAAGDATITERPARPAPSGVTQYAHLEDFIEGTRDGG